LPQSRPPAYWHCRRQLRLMRSERGLRRRLQ
jgi:hypothetical protein